MTDIGQFCSRCGGKDPACYICGTGRQLSAGTEHGWDEDGPDTPDEALDLIIHEAGWLDEHGGDHHEDDCPICRSIAMVRAGLNHAYPPSNGLAQATLWPDIKQLHDAIAECIGREGLTYSGIRRAAKRVQELYAATIAAQPPAAPVEKERLAELQNEAGMYKSLYENAIAQRSSAATDATCYVERSKVRDILIGQDDDHRGILELVLSEIDALPISTAEDFRAAPQTSWRPIETAPHEKYVLLGWWEEDQWNCETGWASRGWRRGGVSNMSRHGQATHWQPLPASPLSRPHHQT